jgi:endonuclease YncB( thermonuclease family)
MAKPKLKSTAKTKIKGLIIAIISIIGLGAFHKELAPLAKIVSDYIVDILLRAPSVPGSVASVHDGDTVTLAGEKEDVRIRLYGIDAPELSQAHGKAARDYLASIIENKAVSVEVIDIDRYGRSVGVITADNESVNLKMLETGNAWFYESYCKKYFCGKWKKAAATAKEKKVGLWKDKNPTPPWEFRRK